MTEGTKHNHRLIRTRLRTEINSNRNILRDCTSGKSLVLTPRLYAPRGELRGNVVSYNKKTDTLTFNKPGQSRVETIPDVCLNYNLEQPEKL